MKGRVTKYIFISILFWSQKMVKMVKGLSSVPIAPFWCHSRFAMIQRSFSLLNFAMILMSFSSTPLVSKQRSKSVACWILSKDFIWSMSNLFCYFFQALLISEVKEGGSPLLLGVEWVYIVYEEITYTLCQSIKNMFL